MIPKDLLTVLEDPQTFHYKDLWLKEENDELRDILELYAFGNINDLNTHLAPQLTDLMLEKLRKQTIVSLSQRYREVSYDLIRRTCQMNNSQDIEKILIELRPIFLVQLDSVNSTAKFIECYDCRDVYDFERKLHVVDVENIVTKEKLRRDLLAWKSKLLTEIMSV